MKRQHECQPPSLRLLRRLRIESGDSVRKVGLCRGDTLSAKVGELRDLVGEDFGDRIAGEKAVLGGRACTVIEEGGQDCYQKIRGRSTSSA